MGSNNTVGKSKSKQPPAAFANGGFDPSSPAAREAMGRITIPYDAARKAMSRMVVPGLNAPMPTPGMGTDTVGRAAPIAQQNTGGGGDMTASLGGSRTFNEDTGTYNTPAVNPDYLGGSKAPNPYADLTMANFYGPQPVQQPITQSLADPYMPRMINDMSTGGLPNTGYQPYAPAPYQPPPSQYTYQPYPDPWTPPAPAPTPAPLTVPQQATQSMFGSFLR